ncbi:hypothetical protein QQF64_034878 [Cirrhinus molitorella]|uniref:Uncharacterized protein n=1 Tax=Cirrhinus molitorella TaxID=172907 RepID=A0ABR3NE59_9TELE
MGRSSEAEADERSADEFFVSGCSSEVILLWLCLFALSGQRAALERPDLRPASIILRWNNDGKNSTYSTQLQ